jgi:hypothetical protein
MLNAEVNAEVENGKENAEGCKFEVALSKKGG